MLEIYFIQIRFSNLWCRIKYTFTETPSFDICHFFLAWMLCWFIQFNRSLKLVVFFFLFLSDTVVCPFPSMRENWVFLYSFYYLTELIYNPFGSTHSNLVCHSYFVLLLRWLSFTLDSCTQKLYVLPSVPIHFIWSKY